MTLAHILDLIWLGFVILTFSLLVFSAWYFKRIYRNHKPSFKQQKNSAKIRLAYCSTLQMMPLSAIGSCVVTFTGGSFQILLIFLNLFLFVAYIEYLLLPAIRSMYAVPYDYDTLANYTSAIRKKTYYKNQNKIDLFLGNKNLAEHRCHNCGHKIVLSQEELANAITLKSRIICEKCTESTQRIFDDIIKKINNS